MRFASTFIVLATLTTTGCGTTLSTMQPAETLRPGHFQANVGGNVNVPVSRIADAAGVVADLGDRYARDPGYRPSEAEQRSALAAGVGLGLSSPGPNPDLMLRYGILEDLDAGIRWSGLAAHVDGKYRFLGGTSRPASSSFTDGIGPDKDGTFQGAISIGVSKALYSGLVFDALDYLNIGDYSRWNVEVPILFGKSLGDYGHVWFGPKYVYSHYSLDASLRNVGILPETSGSIHHIAAFGGIALGYKAVFVFTELTVAKMFAKPEVFGQSTDLGGIVVVPSFGVMLRI